MWGFGGRYYWGRKERGGKVEGIVVVFAWMSSQERQLKNYVELYSSLGWNSLVCHSQFLNMSVFLFDSIRLFWFSQAFWFTHLRVFEIGFLLALTRLWDDCIWLVFLIDWSAVGCCFKFLFPLLPFKLVSLNVRHYYLELLIVSLAKPLIVFIFFYFFLFWVWVLIMLSIMMIWFVWMTSL